MPNAPTTPASVASRLTDEKILKLAKDCDSLVSIDNLTGEADYFGHLEELKAALLRDYVRMRKLNGELRKSLQQAIYGCYGCLNAGECGSPLPFKGCKRKVEWRNLLAEAEKEETK